jgi:hypothetical protein
MLSLPAAKSLCVYIRRNLFESEILAAREFRPRLPQLRCDSARMSLQLLLKISYLSRLVALFHVFRLIPKDVVC